MTTVRLALLLLLPKASVAKTTQPPPLPATGDLVTAPAMCCCLDQRPAKMANSIVDFAVSNSYCRSDVFGPVLAVRTPPPIPAAGGL